MKLFRRRPREPRSGPRIALITGAASGIGRHFAEALSAEGARLILVDIDLAALERLRASLGGEVELHAVDVSSQTAVEAFVERVTPRVSRLDLLINCAGILGAGAFADQPLSAFARVIQVNLMGTVHFTHACLPLLRRARGRVVNLASTASLHGWPMLAAYSAAKGAVENYGEAVRPELAREGISLTTVFPLLVDTPMLANGETPPILKGRRVSAAEVVRESLRAAGRRQARAYVPFAARLVAVVQGLAPPVLDWWGATRGFAKTSRRSAW